jgi:short-subunit dehydrogenase
MKIAQSPASRRTRVRPQRARHVNRAQAEEFAMARLVAITGARAGVGRATAEEFAKRGWMVGMMARDRDRLEAAAAELSKRYRVRTLAAATDVADPAAVEDAATCIERYLGPIDVWVNVAMATVFAPVRDTTPEEFKRATEVTYLGQVCGTMAALRRMRPRNRGTIVNVGSALAYRAVPLQAAYCGAKFAVRGFTDSLRSEILHDRLNIHLTMVQLPAVNTPQFDWALNKTGKQAQPVPPIYQPEVPARAIYFAATHRRREVWVGLPTFKAILANRIAPGLIDRYLASAGYSGQLMHERREPNAPCNLFEPVDGPYGAHGQFDSRARRWSPAMLVTRNRDVVWGAVLAFAVAGVAILRNGRKAA